MSEIPGIETPDISTPELQFPDRCNDCPVLCGLQSVVADAVESTQSTVEFATNLNIPGDLSSASAALGMSPEQLRAHSEGLITDFRKKVAIQLESLDELTQVLQLEADDVTRECPGQFRMRAQNKAGEVITATVCESPEIPKDTHHQSVHITRA